MAKYIPFFQGEKRSIAEKLAKYFECSDLETKIHYDEEKDFYILSVPADKEKEAKKHYQAFYFVERDRIEKEEKTTESLEEIDESNIITGNSFEETDLESVEEEIASTNMDKLSSDTDSDDNNAPNENDTDSTLIDDILEMEGVVTDEEADKDHLEPQSSKLKNFMSGSGSYVMKSEKYKDYTGTQYIFLLLGIAGIIFVILNIAEVLTMLNGFFPNLIMATLFIYFIYVAISTGKKAKQLKLEIDEEKQLTDKINEWLHGTVTEEFLVSITNSELSEELDYMKKTDTIREMLIKEFGDINSDYLDRLIEEFYSETFDSSAIYTEEESKVDTEIE